MAAKTKSVTAPPKNAKPVIVPDEVVPDETPSGEPRLLQVSDVGYRYGSFHALSGASLQADGGELIALVGRNGAGKSTLLKCISGWTRATDGEIHIMGQNIRNNERFVRQHLVLVPDTPPFYDELTAWEHLQFTAQVYGLTVWDERASDLLDRYGLFNNAEAYPFTFSRGMRYKLALCMALLVEPRLLLLDEPLGPLDPVSADDLWEDLGVFRDEGMTILLSSHQLPPEAQPNRYLIMEEGRIIAEGAPDVLRARYAITGELTMDTMLRAAIRERRAARKAAGETDDETSDDA